MRHWWVWNREHWKELTNCCLCLSLSLFPPPPFPDLLFPPSRLSFRQHQEHGAAELWQAAELQDHGDSLRLWAEESQGGRGRAHRCKACLQTWMARSETLSQASLICVSAGDTNGLVTASPGDKVQWDIVSEYLRVKRRHSKWKWQFFEGKTCVPWGEFSPLQQASLEEIRRAAKNPPEGKEEFFFYFLFLPLLF